jgi:branched-chain amino acid transport system permease protein
MGFFLSLLIDGVLAGAIYALIALAFVVVYKASRMINFALGEWIMFGSRLTASGLHGFGLGLAEAVAAACAGMVAIAVLFNRLVLRRLVGSPLIALIMVTLGMGALMRGSAAVVFAGIPGDIPLPIPRHTLFFGDVLVSSEKLAAAAIAAACILAVAWFFRRSRTGLALRAIADDQQVAMAVGIDVQAHFAIAWAMVGIIAVIAGGLWSFVAGGGFGMVLVGLKVFPIVIIGGLDSILGTIAGAAIVGVLESLTAGYIDPLIGGGFGAVASYLVLIVVLFIRPHGLFGRPTAARV